MKAKVLTQPCQQHMVHQAPKKRLLPKILEPNLRRPLKSRAKRAPIFKALRPTSWLKMCRTLAHALAANVQNISLDVIEANQQKIEGNDKLATNRQGLASDAQSAPNVQGVPIDTIAANVQDVPVNTIAANTQNVPVDKVQANQQKLDGNSPITPNKQALANKASGGPNVQGVPIDTVAANVQGVPTDALEDNRQTLDKDALPANQQRIDEETAAANLQALPSKTEGSNRAAFETDAATDNTQALPHNAVANNTQPAPTLAASDNHQAAGEGGMVPANHQGIDTPAPELNRQAAPQDLPPADNRQALDDEHLKDHFEALPSTATERKQVDFPTMNQQTNKKN